MYVQDSGLDDGPGTRDFSIRIWICVDILHVGVDLRENLRVCSSKAHATCSFAIVPVITRVHIILHAHNRDSSAITKEILDRRKKKGLIKVATVSRIKSVSFHTGTR